VALRFRHTAAPHPLIGLSLPLKAFPLHLIKYSSSLSENISFATLPRIRRRTLSKEEIDRSEPLIEEFGIEVRKKVKKRKKREVDELKC